MTWSAELRFHGEYGVEAQILRNGDLTHREDVRAARPRRWVGEERARSAGRRRSIRVRAALFRSSRSMG